MRRFTVIVASAVIVSSAFPASADQRSVEDPRDMPEDAIDIATAEHGHERYQDTVAPFGYRRLLRHRLTMHDDWTYEDPGSIAITIYFNTDRDAEIERELRLHTDDPDAPYAEMKDARGRVRGYAKVTRPDARSIEFVFPKELVRKRLKTYRWRAFATSNFTPPPECRPPNPPCPLPMPLDSVPDDGTMVRHDV